MAAFFTVSWEQTSMLLQGQFYSLLPAVAVLQDPNDNTRMSLVYANKHEEDIWLRKVCAHTACMSKLWQHLAHGMPANWWRLTVPSCVRVAMHSVKGLSLACLAYIPASNACVGLLLHNKRNGPCSKALDGMRCMLARAA